MSVNIKQNNQLTKLAGLYGSGGGSTPSGGTTGQALVKHSNTDGDVEWFDINKEISFDDFNNLNQEEKDNGTSYYIPDASIVSNITVMGNRFDKANIYTTDERMIGRWIDGKPLYQKTIDCGALPNNETKRVSLGLLSTNCIIYSVDCWGVRPGDRNAVIPIPFVDDILKSGDMLMNIETNSGALDIRFMTSADRSSYNAYATIRYTKTTDTTVNIGAENDYSTDEQIIGTWIDGSTLYQKVITGTIGWTATQSIAHNIDNIGFAIIIGSILCYDNAYYDMKTDSHFGYCNVNSTSVTFSKSDAGNYHECPIYFIIQYTKTA